MTAGPHWSVFTWLLESSLPTSPTSVPVYCTRYMMPRSFSFAFILQNTESGSSSAAFTLTTLLKRKADTAVTESFLDLRLLRFQREVESALQPTCWCASCAVFRVFQFSVCRSKKKNTWKWTNQSQHVFTLVESLWQAHLTCCAFC